MVSSKEVAAYGEKDGLYLCILDLIRSLIDVELVCHGGGLVGGGVVFQSSGAELGLGTEFTERCVAEWMQGNWKDTECRKLYEKFIR